MLRALSQISLQIPSAQRDPHKYKVSLLFLSHSPGIALSLSRRGFDDVVHSEDHFRRFRRREEDLTLTLEAFGDAQFDHVADRTAFHVQTASRAAWIYREKRNMRRFRDPRFRYPVHFDDPALALPILGPFLREQCPA